MNYLACGAQMAPIALISILVCGPAEAGVPLSDSADGMTCHSYAVGSGLAWQKKGGDWLDSEGRAHGDTPYASVGFPVRQGRQQVTISITSLAQEWSKGAEPMGGVLLRMVPGTRSPLADFVSKEHPDSSAHPVLKLEWSDGSTSNLRAIADTDLPCSTVSSVGHRQSFQVGDGLSAVLAFPFELRSGATVRSAALVLTSDKQYGNGTSTIGAYRPLVPWAQAPEQVAGLAKSFAFDHGIETHPDVLFMEQFESRRWLRNWSDFDTTGDAEPVEASPEDRLQPLDGRALRVTIKKGKTQGLNMLYRFAQSGREEPEEIFFRYYLRFGESWDPLLEGGKLPGLAGTYGRAGWGGRKSDGHNGWAARGSFFKIPRVPSPLSHLRGIGSYLYHADMGSAHGDGLGWGLGPSGALEKNRWYSIEQQVRMNSPGKRDGVLRAWVDGQLVFEKADVRYRDIPDLRIESVWMNVYHGGTQAAHKDLTLFIDNVVIAKKYIGPTGRQP